MGGCDEATLVAWCVECYDSFPPARVTLLSHVTRFCEEVHPELACASHLDDAAFLSDVVLSLERLHPLLSLTVDGLYCVHAASISRHDRSLYLVYALLCLEKLPLMEWQLFERLVLCQPSSRMHPLLSFLFDDQQQREWMREQWQAVYDVEYVDAVLLHRLRAHAGQVRPLIQRLAASMESAASRKEAGGLLGLAAAAAATATVPRPFSLSASTAKALPLPLALPSRYTAQPPPHLRIRQRSIREVEEEAAARRAATRQRLLEAHAKNAPFHLHALHRPATLPAALTAAQERLKADTAQLSFAHPVPASVSAASSSSSPPALLAAQRATASVILREEELYRRLRLEEDERLLRLVAEQRDAAPFEQWQAERRREDDERRAEGLARRKADMERSHAEAALSVERLQASRAHAALQAKAEAEQRRREALLEEDKERTRKEAQAKALAREEEEKVSAALLACSVRKRETAAALSEEAAELREQRLRRREAELREKRQLRLHIQAMETLAGERAKRVAVVEESRTSGQRLLSDMSIAEMRARLRVLEEREAAEVARKRERIEEGKRLKATVLRAMDDEHAQRRREAKEQRDGERLQAVERLRQVDAAVQERLSEEERELQRRLQAKKQRQLDDATQLATQLQQSRAATQALTKEAEAARVRMERDRTETLQRREQQWKARAAQEETKEAAALSRGEADLQAWREQRRTRAASTRESADRALRELRAQRTEALVEDEQRRRLQVEQLRAQRSRMQKRQQREQPLAQRLSSEDRQRGTEESRRRVEAEQAWRSAERRRLQQRRGLVAAAPASATERVADADAPPSARSAPAESVTARQEEVVRLGSSTQEELTATLQAAAVTLLAGAVSAG